LCRGDDLDTGYIRTILPLDYSTFDHDISQDLQNYILYTCGLYIPEYLWDLYYGCLAIYRHKMANSICVFRGHSWKFVGGMPSGVKTTNDIESLMNAAIMMLMFKLVIQK